MTRRAAILVVALTLFVSACTRGGPLATSSSTPTAPPAKLSWSDCGGGFQCSSVQVPLDYTHPDAGTIRIALNRKPATDPANRIGSLLVNPGGPGASGIDYVRSAASLMANLNRRFDLVGFDPRGVGQSAPVRCLSSAQEDAFNALDSVYDDPQEKSAGIAADKEFAAGCEQRSAKTLAFVDTESAARDMDAIRAAVGDDKLTYLGFSYGTFLGENYAHLFPTHIRAMVLDGVIDPTLEENDRLLQQTAGFQDNLNQYFAQCPQRPTCTFARSGDGQAQLLAFMQRLDATPMQVGNRQLTRSLAMTGVLLGFYDPGTWQYLDTALAQAYDGNGGVLLQFADLYLGRKADGSYTNETDAFSAITCLDRPVPSDVATYDALTDAFRNASPVFGPWVQYSYLVCAYWPVKPKGEPGPITVEGAPPILLVGGTHDPATPYAGAKAVAGQIAGSVLLTRDGYGHVSYDKSTCAQQFEDSYLIDLKTPPAGTVCT